MWPSIEVMNPNHIGADKLYEASVTQDKIEDLREVRGFFFQNCENQEVSPRGGASTTLLCQELGNSPVIMSLHATSACKHSKKS